MQIQNTEIIDTFAEAFSMCFARLVVTAHDDYWLDAGLREFTGYSSSVISCDAETGIERLLSQDQTPDGRIGASVLVFGFSVEALAKSVPNRVGQCLMTCPTTAVYDGLPESDQRIGLGKQIRYFGDGFQKSKLLFGRRYWRIPVMDGEFLVEDKVGVAKGIAGGNIILQARSTDAALAAARRGTEALDQMDGVIAPFPAGVVRSGSKVGSVYKGLVASTSDSYCPTLRGRVETNLSNAAASALEIVLDGVSEQAVAAALRVVIQSAAGNDVVAIGAGNYGGKLGKFQFHLHDLLK
ncbi:MAG: formylmethanofuran--tetrahydromethanopterin N-formyltransferase [Pirellulales bacterium]